jgi:hypothetical protein
VALTRRALDPTQFQMGKLLGADMPTWSTYEAGLERIPPDEALKLAPHGIPLNWIYEGKMTNLPPHIRAFGNCSASESGQEREGAQNVAGTGAEPGAVHPRSNSRAGEKS